MFFRWRSLPKVIESKSSNLKVEGIEYDWRFGKADAARTQLKMDLSISSLKKSQINPFVRKTLYSIGTALHLRYDVPMLADLHRIIEIAPTIEGEGYFIR
jgi:hypothetical protein